MNRKKKLIIIYGPTTSGKTSLAISLAKKFKTEVISADSRQVYCGFDIGTNKYSPTDEIIKNAGYWLVNGVKVHLYDTTTPNTSYSVSRFKKDFDRVLSDIYKNHDIAILAGGSGLYISSVVNPIQTIAIKPNRKLRKELEPLSVQMLQKKLKEVNAKKISQMNQSDIANPRRLIRAIEVSLSRSKIKKESTENNRFSDYFFIFLQPSKESVNRKIDLWYRTRLKMGILEEVIDLRKLYPPHAIEQLGLVYKYISRYLDRKISKKELDYHLPISIHRFAKSQMLWFRTQEKIHKYNTDSFSKNDLFKKISSDVSAWYNS